MGNAEINNALSFLYFQVYKLAQEKNIKVHFDGARLLNASVALGIAPSEITKYCDSVSLCFSKVDLYHLFLFLLLM